LTLTANFLQRPPVTDASLLYPDVYYNGFLLQLANASVFQDPRPSRSLAHSCSYLGPRPVFNWLTANTALANTGGMRQPAHKDCSFVHPQYPYYFIANVPLCDFQVDNGATEFWLGSHAAASHREQVVATDPKQVEAYGRLGEPLPYITEQAKTARQKIRPPIQPPCSVGDIMVRDLRTWHAGMPNQTSKHRIMIGLGYQVSQTSVSLSVHHVK
jgi:hypothetical protein